MKYDNQHAVLKELTHLCGVTNKQFNKDIPIYKEHNKKREIAKIAISTILPLADLILHIQDALGHEAMSTWLTQSLRGAHVNALHAVAGQEFALPYRMQVGIAQSFADLTISQAKYGEILGMKSQQESKKFMNAIEDNVLAYYLEEFDTFYSIKKTVDMYEETNDWLSTTAIGVHIHVVHMTAHQFGYDADVPGLVLNQ